MDLRQRKHRELKNWIKKWGNFKTDEEVETYPYCMVDVMAIMQMYAAHKRKPKTPTAGGGK